MPYTDDDVYAALNRIVPYEVVAINGRKWAPEVLPEEIRAAKKTTSPIEITAEHGDVVRAFRVNYHDGEQYPHLERDDSRPDLLSVILAARAR